MPGRVSGTHRLSILRRPGCYKMLSRRSRSKSRSRTSGSSDDIKTSETSTRQSGDCVRRPQPRPLRRFWRRRGRMRASTRMLRRGCSPLERRACLLPRRPETRVRGTTTRCSWLGCYVGPLLERSQNVRFVRIHSGRVFVGRRTRGSLQRSRSSGVTDRAMRGVISSFSFLRTARRVRLDRAIAVRHGGFASDTLASDSHEGASSAPLRVKRKISICSAVTGARDVESWLAQSRAARRYAQYPAAGFVR
jgi:hypothetical protein